MAHGPAHLGNAALYDGLISTTAPAATPTTQPMEITEQSTSATEHLYIKLSHDCRGFGCTESSCTLCQNIELRRCPNNQPPLLAKYVTKEVLQSRCNGTLTVQVVDQNNKICNMSDTVEVYALTPSTIDDAFEENQPLSNALPLPLLQDAPLALRWGDHRGNAIQKVSRQLQAGQASLDQLRIDTHRLAGNHAGVSCQFKLVITCPGNDNVTPYVSSNFGVVDPRSRKAQKPICLHSSDPVSALHGFAKGSGSKEGSVDKLAALYEKMMVVNPDAAALLPTNLRSITLVDQFQQLYTLLQQPHMEALKTALIPALFKNADWKRAVDHAATAVYPDDRPRVWWVPDSILAQQQQQQQQQQQGGILAQPKQQQGGILSQQQQQKVGVMYACRGGRVQLHAPFAVVDQPSAGGDVIRLLDQQQLLLLPFAWRLAAVNDWNSAGHGSWEIYDGLLPHHVAAAAADKVRQQQGLPQTTPEAVAAYHQQQLAAAAAQATSNQHLRPQQQQQQQQVVTINLTLLQQFLMRQQQQQQQSAALQQIAAQPVLLPLAVPQQQQPPIKSEVQHTTTCIAAAAAAGAPLGGDSIDNSWWQQQQAAADLPTPFAVADGASAATTADPFTAAAAAGGEGFMAMLQSEELPAASALIADAQQQQQQQQCPSIEMLDAMISDPPPAAAAAVATNAVDRDSLDVLFSFLDKSETQVALAIAAEQLFNSNPAPLAAQQEYWCQQQQQQQQPSRFARQESLGPPEEETAAAAAAEIKGAAAAAAGHDLSLDRAEAVRFVKLSVHMDSLKVEDCLKSV